MNVADIQWLPPRGGSRRKTGGGECATIELVLNSSYTQAPSVIFLRKCHLPLGGRRFLCEQHGYIVGTGVLDCPLYKKCYFHIERVVVGADPYRVSVNIVGECLGAPVLQKNVTFTQKNGRPWVALADLIYMIKIIEATRNITIEHIANGERSASAISCAVL